MTLINQLQESITTLQKNEILSGGIVLMVIGGLLASLYRLPRQIFNWAKARLILSVQVPGSDEAYSWLIAWLTSLQSQKNARSLLLKSIGVNASHDHQHRQINSSQELMLVFIPYLGIHFFRFKHKLFWYSMTRERIKTSDMMMGWDETLTICTFGGSRKILSEMIAYAKECVSPSQGYVEIMTHRWGSWSLKCRKRIRQINQLILDGDTAEFIVQDVRAFLDGEEWYLDKGIPWRRGYLLYGPPGTGKSSLIEVIAGVFNLRIFLLELRGMSDSDLINALALVPEASMIVIEDIDVMYRDRHELADVHVPSFGALLNGIDGISAQEGRLLFMTTNYRDRLDEALLRPGRADVHINLGYASRSQIQRMFLKFFPAAQEAAQRFALSLPDQQLSMAKIQEHLVRYKNSPDLAVEQALFILEEYKQHK